MYSCYMYILHTHGMFHVLRRESFMSSDGKASYLRVGKFHVLGQESLIQLIKGGVSVFTCSFVIVDIKLLI